MFFVTCIDNSRSWNLENIRGAHGVRQLICDDERIESHDDYNREQKRVQSWTVDTEEALKPLLEYMSTNHCGVDIKVFRLEKIIHRAPGELKEKQVTKDGVLPV